MHGIYRIRIMLKEWGTLFWSLAFPLFLGIVFYFMFGNIAEMEMFQEMPVGVVTSAEAENTEFLEFAKTIEMDDGVHMFAITEFASMDEALVSLQDEKIRGIIDLNNDYELTIMDSETDTSLIKSFVDQYKQNEKLIRNMIETNPELVPAIVEGIKNEADREIVLSNIELKGQDKDCYSQYFFAIIAMTCLIGCTVGLGITKNIQADVSAIGARRNVAPTSKARQIVTDFIATFFVYDVLTVIVVLFMVFVLKRDFGTNLPLVFLSTFVGNFNGISAGLLIGVLVKGSNSKKEGLCVTYFMASSFLAGLQWNNITFVLEKNCPIINRINPATLIVNSFKSLAVFGDIEKYLYNILTLFAIGVLFLVLSIMKLRRMKYASI